MKAAWLKIMLPVFQEKLKYRHFSNPHF